MNNLSRYAIFVYDDDFAFGGWKDFYKAVDSTHEAREIADWAIDISNFSHSDTGKQFPYDNVQVVDLDSSKIIYAWTNGPDGKVEMDA